MKLKRRNREENLLLDLREEMIRGRQTIAQVSAQQREMLRERVKK